ncbi:hypothetical protein LTR10_017048 [Elasticomyces elasticus]|uniref:Uncharacterized protein n=1 Tax=Exophiala sideris TaxID=1016849 RepID=A0ABR0IZ91_9EURO|nr:hypothetical protein LTR10_017048 [Elasticomyces elasticus]KAK5023056.1 hypothetical protein LTS07_009549 [Exophiala sideris]KAK5026781.1 hypothetical protein LTR13_009821 [Exophiala sideris]KAK5052434.1 hypothetical protein LTR69_009772 [Exophiala sideris]KAK5178219.1 hypothetical protein LTR44_009303 [Eurotiomycetes sp. CCFEE 6388]
MGLRIKLRKTFSSSSAKKSSFPDCSPTGEKYYTDRTDIEYYKPNEIPKSKYKGRVDPEHAASLAAFSLADAFSLAKKRSSAALSGTFSPRGTNAQSRAASRMASRAQSRATSRAPSRRPSFDVHRSNLRTEAHADSSISSSGTASISASTALDIETASTSISNHTTAVASAPAERNMKLVDSGIGMDMPDIVLTKQMTAHDTPFTVEELEQAMTRASLKPKIFAHEEYQMPTRRRAIA